jgi:ribose/xylose/arabinose/galactoside ABC-type transport system permease subunit
MASQAIKGERHALLVGTGSFRDPMLSTLLAPVEDVEAFKDVLRDPAICGFQSAECLIDPDIEKLQEALHNLFDDRDTHDLLLFYYTGHGLRDASDTLYLALNKTHAQKPSIGSLEAEFVRKRMKFSDAETQVIILDCCHSGAFMKGRKGTDVQPAIIGEAFDAGGTGQYVLSACTKSQQAFEREGTDDAKPHSIFTRSIVKGLLSGDAALDQELVTMDALYKYTRKQVLAHKMPMDPQRWISEGSGDPVIAKNPNIRKAVPKEYSDALLKDDEHARLWAVGKIVEMMRKEPDSIRDQHARGLLEIALKSATWISVGDAIKAALSTPKKSQTVVSRNNLHQQTSPSTPAKSNKTRPPSNLKDTEVLPITPEAKPRKHIKTPKKPIDKLPETKPEDRGSNISIAEINEPTRRLFNSRESTWSNPRPVHITRKSKQQLFAQYFPMLCLALALAVLSMFNPVLLSNISLQMIFTQTVFIGLMAIGLTFVMLVGGIDLAVGALFALAGTAVGLANEDYVWWFCIVAVPVAGFIFGGMQHFFINASTTHSSYGPNRRSIVVTLIGFYLLSYVPPFMLVSKSFRFYPFDEMDYSWAVSGPEKLLNVLLFIFTIVAAIAQLILFFSPFGKEIEYFRARHGRFGINRHWESESQLAYCLCGLLSASAGALFAVSFDTAPAFFGSSYGLAVIASVVVGGVSVFGGIGNIWGTVTGVVLVAALNTSLVLLGFNGLTQFVWNFLLIVFAVTLDFFLGGDGFLEN